MRPRAVSVVLAAMLPLSVAASAPDAVPKMLELTIRVDGSLGAKGGIVFVMPRKITREDFIERHEQTSEKGAPDSESGHVRDWPVEAEAIVRATVSFVQFDVPDAAYSYRFVPLASAGEPAVPLREAIVSSGGSGYTDPVSGLPLQNNPTIVHHLAGSDLSADLAWALAGEGHRFKMSPDQCRVADTVTVCDGSLKDLQAAISHIDAVERDSR